MGKSLSILDLFRIFGHPKAKLSPYYPVYQRSDLGFSSASKDVLVLLWLLCGVEAAVLVLQQCVCYTQHEMCWLRTLICILGSISRMSSVKYQGF